LESIQINLNVNDLSIVIDILAWDSK